MTSKLRIKGHVVVVEVELHFDQFNRLSDLANNIMRVHICILYMLFISCFFDSLTTML